MAQIDGVRMIASKYTDGPNECGYFTAGIDAHNLKDIRGNPDIHYHAIEFNHKDKNVAEQWRDHVLSILSGEST